MCVDEGVVGCQVFRHIVIIIKAHSKRTVTRAHTREAQLTRLPLSRSKNPSS